MSKVEFSDDCENVVLSGLTEKETNTENKILVNGPWGHCYVSSDDSHGYYKLAPNHLNNEPATIEKEKECKMENGKIFTIKELSAVLNIPVTTCNGFVKTMIALGQIEVVGVRSAKVGKPASLFKFTEKCTITIPESVE